MFSVLILDDCPERGRAFLARFPHARWVETASEAIASLQSLAWDLVCLDHDLGGEHFVDSRQANTGAEVVRFIVRDRPPISQIIVHSLNGPAAARMVADLDSAGYAATQVPFFWMRPDITVTINGETI